MATNPDYTEVGRMAHELEHSHGWNAHKYAAKLAAEARSEGKTEEFEFWKAVEDTVKPREDSL